MNSSGAEEIAAAWLEQQLMQKEIRGLTVEELLKKSASCCENGLSLHIMCKECRRSVVTVEE
jgi:hypothetical protein